MQINTTVNRIKFLSPNYADGLRKLAPKAMIYTGNEGIDHSVRHALQKLKGILQNTVALLRS